MKHRSLFPVLCFVLVSFFDVPLVSAQTCLNSGNFIPNSTYDANLRLIISSLPSNVTAQDGFFYNGSIGHEPDRVYAIGMCIPGSTSHDCSDCIKTAVDGLVKNCPKQTEAYWWKGETILCLVRYSNNSLSADPKPHHLSYNTEDINSNLTKFMEIWQGLVGRIIVEASTAKSTPSSSNNYYKADVSALTPYQDIYAMMQCTPDLSSADCYKCLRKSTRNYQSCCGQKSGGTVFGPSCFFRWEMYSFSKAFGNITTASPSPSPPMQAPSAGNRVNKTDNGNVKISTRAIKEIIVPIIVAVFIVIILVPFARKSTKFLWRKEQYQDVVDYDQSGADTLQLDFKTIEAATNNFSRSNKLGQGGFGEVFKGTLINGTEVAVKRLSKASEQGAEEFKNEVVVVAKLHHRNLVRLLGFCIEGEEKILVYEFVANKSLDYILFDPRKQIQLDWKRRYNIIHGIARGILYLHQDSRLTVIHRDLKASNVLLDTDMNPKIADFGMARIFGMDQSGANTSRIVGTRGYMPPEYVMQGLFSTKSDVYSFGVLVLEIISGRNNRFFQESDTTVENLVTYAWRLWRKGSPLELLDPTISKNCQTHQATKCIHIALLCVQEDPNDRPALSTVMLMLTSNSVSLTVPQPPGFFFPNRRNQERDGFVSSHSTIRSSSQTINDVTISDLEPR